MMDIVLVLLRAWASWGRRPAIFAILGLLFILYASVCVAILLWGLIAVGGGYGFYAFLRLIDKVGVVDAYPLAHIVGTCVSFVPREFIISSVVRRIVC